MKRCWLECVLVVLAPSALLAQPAVPLIAHDPYFSVWSESDRLTDDWPKHWSNATMGMSGLVVVDGKAFRWCGPAPAGIPAAEQTARLVSPTTTSFTFSAGGTELSVAFYSPVEPDRDLARLSQSVSAVSFGARSADGRAHDAAVYLDVTGEWCSNSSQDEVSWTRHRADELGIVSMGTVAQPVLEHSGDARKIDWGRVYLAAEERSGNDARSRISVGGHERSRLTFATTGRVPDRDDVRTPRAVNDDWPVLAVSVDLGHIEASAAAGASVRRVFVGYDEGRAIELFERPLKPLWKSLGEDDIVSSVLALNREMKSGNSSRPSTAQFVEAATRVGGREYAEVVSLAYRQVLAGHKIVADWDGTPLMFSKENTSNGCIATIDVIYPASPFYLYHNPEMLKASLRPLLAYAASPRWKFPFAPHDLGTYPKANGQVYGGGERGEQDQMPVEESGNMLIMLAALAKVEGNAEFSRPYLPMLEKWAGYLKDNGLDPANQLCTDDFAGHLARNANLSAKTCVALAGYAQLLKAAGKAEESARWRTVAETFATRWKELAAGPEATVLVFGAAPVAGAGSKAPNGPSWSQKYNLVWDRALGLGLFGDEVFAKEMKWYKGRLGKFGLPLDSRMTYTKLDWSVWSACLTRSRADFDAILKPTYAWASSSPPPSRVPLSDWYETTDGTTKGMYARTVVGGIWMPLLMDKLGTGLR